MSPSKFEWKSQAPKLENFSNKFFKREKERITSKVRSLTLFPFDGCDDFDGCDGFDDCDGCDGLWVAIALGSRGWKKILNKDLSIGQKKNKRADLDPSLWKRIIESGIHNTNFLQSEI